jgi:hypothetical protein
MNVDGPNEGASQYQPGSMPSSSFASTKSTWYKRPWVLSVVGVVLIVGLSVLMDLPSRSSNQQQAADLAPQIRLINQDSRPCAYAVRETFQILSDSAHHHLSALERARAPKMLTDDQTACSFASGPLYDLTNNIDIGFTRAGIPINHLLTTVTTWASSDALAAVNDIQKLYLHPGTRSLIEDLGRRIALLSSDRMKAFADVRQAETILHVKLPHPILPSLNIDLTLL